MVAIEIEPTTERRIKAFQGVVEAILEEPVGLEVLVELVLQRGLRAMLSDVIGNVEPEILLQSIFQMAEENPEFVYGFTAARLHDGASTREAAKRQLGFIKPTLPKQEGGE
jgi:hypothetical protein